MGGVGDSSNKDLWTYGSIDFNPYVQVWPGPLVPDDTGSSVH